MARSWYSRGWLRLLTAILTVAAFDEVRDRCRSFATTADLAGARAYLENSSPSDRSHDGLPPASELAYHVISFSDADKREAGELVGLLALAFEFGASPDLTVGRYSLLQNAASLDHSTLARFLIERGARINRATHTSMPPLHLAAGEGALETVQLLLGHGAHLEQRNTYNETPLFRAVAYGNWEVMEFLLEQGAELDVQNSDGSTLLHAVLNAAPQSPPAVVEFTCQLLRRFVQLGVDPDLPDAGGLSARALSAKMECKEYLHAIQSTVAEMAAEELDGSTQAATQGKPRRSL